MTAGISSLERVRWLTAVMRSEKTTHKGRAVAAALLTYHNTITGQTNPSLKKLAERADLGETATRQGLRELEAAGFLETKPQTGTSSQYNILHTPTPDAPPSNASRAPTPTPRVPKPCKPEPSNEPAPIGADDWVSGIDVDAVLSAHDPVEVHDAIAGLAMTPARWGTGLLRIQVASAVKRGRLRVPEGERSHLTVRV